MLHIWSIFIRYNKIKIQSNKQIKKKALHVHYLDIILNLLNQPLTTLDSKRPQITQNPTSEVSKYFYLKVLGMVQKNSLLNLSLYFLKAVKVVSKTLCHVLSLENNT